MNLGHPVCAWSETWDPARRAQFRRSCCGVEELVEPSPLTLSVWAWRASLAAPRLPAGPLAIEAAA